MSTTDDNKYITTSSFIEYQTKKIKRTFDTKITEFSTEGSYDYLPGPSLKVITPNGGEKYWADDTTKIEWYCEEADLMPNVNLYYVDGENLTLISPNVINNATSSFDWKIPENANPTTQAKILVSGSFDGEPFLDYSDEFFIVDKRYIKLNNFNTPTIQANIGNTFTLTWNSNGISNNIRVEMLNYSDNSVLKTIETNYFISSSQYVWTIDGIEKTVDKVKLKVIDVKHPKIFDISNIIDLLVPYIQNVSVDLVTYSPTLRLYPLSLNSTYNPAIRITNFDII
jgi:hypothetical protein